MDDIPADLLGFYRGGYQPIPVSLSKLRELAAGERYRMKPILKYKRGGKLLEIGPWMGVFSCNAKDAGFQVTAIEMDKNCVDFLQEVVGVRALQSSNPADSLRTLDEKFDVIALWHSLEHLRDPWIVIQHAAKRLAPGGILVVAIPNIQSYQYSIMKSAWKHLDAPRHLFFYPIESLEKLCHKNGLSTLEITTGDELSNALSKDSWRSFATSIVPVRYVRGVLALILRAAAYRNESRINAGTGVTAVFQLPSGE
jgi:2-polyprenyl-3-methyl-5-hydroxy-6-metoxy-1,4-benzoquinol methylase